MPPSDDLDGNFVGDPGHYHLAGEGQFWNRQGETVQHFLCGVFQEEKVRIGTSASTSILV